MARKQNPAGRPTDAEFNILRMIWELESATVREVYDHLAQDQDIGYTTVLKLMQIMTDKGLLERDTAVRPQVYRPSQPRKKTQQHLLRDLADRAFSGSAGSLALQALAMKKSTPEEIQEIRALLDRQEGPC